MISNFRKFVFIKVLSIFVCAVFLLTQLELKVFAQPALAPNPIFGGETSKYQFPNTSLASTGELLPVVNSTILATYEVAKLVDKGAFEGTFANNVYTSIATYTYDDPQKQNCTGRLRNTGVG